MSPGWSYYVIALVVLNILGCVWLIWWTGKRRPGDPGPTDTSHVWDGNLTEYNQPMPRWWINLFYITIVFSIGYLVYYPGMGSFKGTSGWTSQAEHDADKAVQDARLEKAFAPYAGKPLPELAGDPTALKLGQSIFANNCATCHGSSGQGAIGYPNLADRVWHWGGEPDAILQTVLEGRQAAMPAWGTVLAGMGGEQAQDYVIAYVRSLAKPTAKPDFMAAQGKPLYDGVCAACHGAGGKGNPALGAPDLTDDYWLYGDSNESLYATISTGRKGVMPAHGPLLGETRARLAAAYVWSLSQSSVAAQATPAATAAEPGDAAAP
jgi:cytochrome c oxidase cbb3-type subunit 3